MSSQSGLLRDMNRGRSEKVINVAREPDLFGVDIT